MNDLLLGLHTLDWLILAAYLVAVVVIGVWTARRIENVSDYFMGGRRFGKAFMMFFAFGSGTSSDQAITVVAGTWRTGLAGIWWQFLWLPATPFYWLIAPLLRRTRALTTADFFEARFNSATAVLYSFYGIIVSIVFIAGGLYGSGKMINALTGNQLDVMAERMDVRIPSLSAKRISTGMRDEEGDPVADSRLTFSLNYRRVEGYEYAILAMTVLFVTYGMAGGLSAAVVTDFLQGILTVAFSILLLPFVFSRIGGIGGVHQQSHLKPGLFDFVASPEIAAALGKEPIDLFYVVVLSVTALAGIIVQPHIMGVCGAGKTEMEGRFGFTAGNFLKRFCTVAWTFTGLACIAWYLGPQSPLLSSDRPEDRELHAALVAAADPASADMNEGQLQAVLETDKQFADELFGRAAYDLLPSIAPGLIGLLMASLLAAVMSTSDAQMVVASGLFTTNIYRYHLRPHQSERHYVWVGRLAGVVIVAGALVLQATFSDVIDAMKTIVMTPAAIGISMWFGLFWRRWNVYAVWISTLAAVSAWVAVAWFTPAIQAVVPDSFSFIFRQTPTGETMISGAWQGVIYLTAGVTAGVITTLLTAPLGTGQIDEFFTLLRSPVLPDEKVPGPCRLPEGHNKRDPVIEIGNWQFPRPTRLGTGGFILACLLVGAIVLGTKLLSQIL